MASLSTEPLFRARIDLDDYALFGEVLELAEIDFVIQRCRQSIIGHFRQNNLDSLKKKIPEGKVTILAAVS